MDETGLEGGVHLCCDKLIEGRQYGQMTNGIRYREVRQYQTDFHVWTSKDRPS
ncbi:hypothetical protein DPMN_075314 [Dreissena polymorpha]|uniref:Uncharacterized protein n=1 Tax=Dreissena polymorpha TaxID=45954 RepID=A0A9D4BME2_DREPO|nr:hypothetical protein DPMN_075314 [Dreissena polymorpha]